MANLLPEEVPRILDPEDVRAQVREYAKVKAVIDQMEFRAKELREKLFGHLDQEGFEDTQGNLLYEFDEPIEGIVRLEKQRRVSRKIDEFKAEEIIQKNGLADSVYETKLVVNEDALMAAFYEGKLSEEELDDMFPPKVTWALMTKRK